MENFVRTVSINNTTDGKLKRDNKGVQVHSFIAHELPTKLNFSNITYVKSCNIWMIFPVR